MYDMSEKPNRKESKMINIMADFLFFMTLIICIITKIKNKTEQSNHTNQWLEKYAKFIFIVIFIISSVLLTYKIENIPQGLHVDEAGAWYDAICISKYGVDRYLYKLPVYFINFGGGQNALYTYLSAICIRIFGVSKTIFRLPAVLVSLLSLIVLYKMIAENKDKKNALFISFILVVSPFFVMKSRWGLESYLMSSLLTISTFIFMKALNSDKLFWYILSGVFWGLTLYTYAIAYIAIPAIIGMVLLFMILLKKIKIKNILAMAIPLGILAIPLILMLVINSGILEKATIPIFSIPKLWFYRGGEISFKNILPNINHIFEILFTKDFLNYNAIEGFGTLYKLSIPLVIFGLVEVIQNVIKDFNKKELSLDFIMLVTFIIMFLLGLCIAELNINKINAIYIPMIYFAGRFVAYSSDKMKYVGIVIVLAYCLEAGFFLHNYFTEFAKSDLMYFEEEIIEASRKAESLQKNKIYVENCLNQTYIYTLIATPISPYEFQENLQIENEIVTQYGKYTFQIPEPIDEDAVYMIKNDAEKLNALIKNGFETQLYGEIHVLWKN